MVDNVESASGSGGPTFATDEITSVHYPRVKVDWGPDGTANDVDAASGKGLPVQGEAAHDAAATGNPVMAGAQFDDTTPDSVDEGDVGRLRISANRNLYVTIRDAAGNERGLNVDASGNIGVTDAGGALTVDGTVTANLSATDNAVLDQIDNNTDYGAVTGGGTETGALRVTLANNSTGVLSVDDNGGALTVDNGGTFAVQVDGDALTALQLIDDPVFADDAAFTLTSSKVSMAGAVRDDSLSTLSAAEGDAVPLRVNSTGALHVTGAGGGTQYNVDDAAGGTDTGTLALAVRDDSLSTLTPADGDYTPLRVSSTGALHVTGGGGGTEYNEDVATPATITGTATMMERDDALSSLTPVEGDWAAMRCSAEGALWVQEFNSDAILADTANMDTNLGTIAGAVSGTEMQVDVVGALPTGSNAIGKLAANSGVDIGDVDVTSISAGSNLIGDVGISGARTSGGTTIFRSLDLDESEEEVKSSGGQLYWIHAMNLATGVRYLKVYNATAANVTVGTTTPVLTFPLPTQGDANGAGFTLAIPNGIAFDTAITVAATTGIADNDTGAPGTNEVVINLGYA